MKHLLNQSKSLFIALAIIILFLGTTACEDDGKIIPYDSNDIENSSNFPDNTTVPTDPTKPGTGTKTSPESDPSQVVQEDNYPIILCNGFAGTDYILWGLVEFMYQIKSTLENTGREVYYAPVPALNNSEVRAQVIADTIYQVMLQKVVEQAKEDTGRETISEVDKLQVDISNMKFNFICHSQGGINVRYLTRLISIPDPRYDNPTTAPKWSGSLFTASISMLSTPNTGTYVAEWIAKDAPSYITQIAEVVGDFYEGILNGDDPDESSLIAAGLEMAESNMKENMNPMLLNGYDCSHIKVFHWSASVELFHLFHTNNPFIRVMKAINEMDPTEERKLNDGVVCTISAEWQPSLADYANAGADSSLGMNWQFMGRLENVDHFQLINQILGNMGFGFSKWSPINFYESHAEYLAEQGL